MEGKKQSYLTRRSISDEELAKRLSEMQKDSEEVSLSSKKAPLSPEREQYLRKRVRERDDDALAELLAHS